MILEKEGKKGLGEPAPERSIKKIKERKDLCLVCECQIKAKSLQDLFGKGELFLDHFSEVHRSIAFFTASSGKER